MSLARVLEPEIMDSPGDASDYDAMDHAEVNRRFAADFLAARAMAGVDSAGEILDLGTGTALIPIELCRQDARATIVAVDLAHSMLDLARKNITQAGPDIRGRVVLQRADVKRLPFRDAQFPSVISNATVHHIPEPREMLAEAVRVLSSPGLIFVRDLLRPAEESILRGIVETYAGAANAHQRQLFADSLRASLTLAEVRGMVAELGFAPGDVQTTSDRHWTWHSLAVPCRRLLSPAVS